MQGMLSQSASSVSSPTTSQYKYTERGKSRGRREAIIPLYDGLRAVLKRIPKRATAFARETQWFETATPCKRRAGISELNFNDLRGTAATKFYAAEIEQRIITEILAWEEDHVARIVRRYVGRAPRRAS
jgi:hypothetical protein